MGLVEQEESSMRGVRDRGAHRPPGSAVQHTGRVQQALQQGDGQDSLTVRCW